MSLLGPVNYANVHETMEGVVSPEEELSRDNGWVAHLTYQCDWVDRIQLAIDKLTANGGLGETYPHNTLHNARACSAKIRPASGQMYTVAGTLAQYEHAHVTITYKTPGRNQDQQPETSNLINETLEGHAQGLTLDYRKFGWFGPKDTKGVWLTQDEAPFKIVRDLDYCVSVHNVINLPTQILQLSGTVNDSTIFSPTLQLSFPPETLLFADPVLTRKYSLDQGQGSWTVSYRFNIQFNYDNSNTPQGWNSFWRADTGQYERIYQNMGTSASPNWQQYYLYPTASLSGLLPFA